MLPIDVVVVVVVVVVLDWYVDDDHNIRQLYVMNRNHDVVEHKTKQNVFLSFKPNCQMLFLLCVHFNFDYWIFAVTNTASL